MRGWLQSRIDGEERKLRTLAEKIIKAMSFFKDEFKLETAEIDASLAATFEYENLLKKLNADDLPRYEARFKELLNVNTINEIANFNAQLAREREDIKERIALINTSLTQIDYNPGRFIVLESQPTPDADIRDFQSELRACTEGALTGSEDAQYSEAKFMQVKNIIDRFRGRDTSTRSERGRPSGVSIDLPCSSFRRTSLLRTSQPGSTPNCVTVGPSLISTTVASTPKLASVSTIS